MILRVWQGWTSPEMASHYAALLRSDIFPAIVGRAIPGFRGIELGRRSVDDAVEFVTVMRFDSLEAVRTFAGPDFEVAVVPPRAREILLRFEERSAHYELVEARPAA